MEYLMEELKQNTFCMLTYFFFYALKTLPKHMQKNNQTTDQIFWLTTLSHVIWILFN